MTVIYVAGSDILSVPKCLSVPKDCVTEVCLLLALSAGFFSSSPHCCCCCCCCCYCCCTLIFSIVIKSHKPHKVRGVFVTDFRSPPTHVQYTVVAVLQSEGRTTHDCACGRSSLVSTLHPQHLHSQSWTSHMTWQAHGDEA